MKYNQMGYIYSLKIRNFTRTVKYQLNYVCGYDVFKYNLHRLVQTSISGGQQFGCLPRKT